MGIKNSTVRKAMLWLAIPFGFGIIGGFLLNNFVGPIFYQALQDHGELKKPEALAWSIMTHLAHILSSGWFRVVAGAVVGLAAGVWLDAFLRNKEAKDFIAAQPKPEENLKLGLSPVELAALAAQRTSVKVELKMSEILPKRPTGINIKMIGGGAKHFHTFIKPLPGTPVNLETDGVEFSNFGMLVDEGGQAPLLRNDIPRLPPELDSSPRMSDAGWALFDNHKDALRTANSLEEFTGLLKDKFLEPEWGAMQQTIREVWGLKRYLIF